MRSFLRKYTYLCRQLVANQMHQACINFARNGNPNSDNLTEWPKYDVTDRSTMIFNIESAVENDPNREERIIWEQATMMMKS